jgi:hypothetical protein
MGAMVGSGAARRREGGQWAGLRGRGGGAVGGRKSS